MAGRSRKGTTDADGDGEMGGSLPQRMEERVARLEDRVAYLAALMRRNGWTMGD